jgi:hypothetical protein
MDNKPPVPRKVLPWVVIGALVGAVSTALDGAVIGALSANPSGAARLEKALRWAGYFAAAGAFLGAIVGLLARAILPRLVLRPPGEEGSEEG